MLKCDAVVPAAGIGSRMGAEIPKQYLKITSTQTILEYTLQKLLTCAQVDRVIVVLNPQDELFAALPIARHPRIVTAAGGAERADSVLSGLKQVTTPWVMVHDAARPLVSLSDIEKLTACCESHDCGAILAAAAADTLKLTAGSLIEQTLPRERIFRAQTPQCFKTAELSRALSTALSRGLCITDEASAMEAAGLPCRIVAGRSDNFKITTKEDLLLAKALLQYEC